MSIYNSVIDKENQDEESRFCVLTVPLLRQCDLRLTHRLTLAALIYRTRLTGASIMWLARFTFSSKNTIKSHLAVLEQRGYAEKCDDKWYAVENAHYVQKKNCEETDWFKRICYFRVIKNEGTKNERKAARANKDGERKTIRVADRPQLTEMALTGLGKTKLAASRKQTIRGLAKMLGVDRKMIRTALNNLRAIDIVTIRKKPGGFVFATYKSKAWKLWHGEASDT
jgi:hypothetical protein